MSLFSIHGSRLPLLIILLFIKQRRHVVAVKTLFCKISKGNVHKRKIWTCYICQIFLRIQWYFLEVSVIKIECSTAKTNPIFDKTVSKRWFFCNFLNRMQNSTTQFTTTSICHQQTVSFGQIAQIHYFWFGYKIYMGKLCSTASNWLIFTVRR